MSEFKILRFFCRRFFSFFFIIRSANASFFETRPALGHDWKDNGNGTATCQREGCGRSHTHTLDEGEVTTKPSCEEKGVKTYHCTEANCNYTKTEDIAATGHNWDDGKITTEASCDHTGVKTYTCKTCGYPHLYL